MKYCKYFSREIFKALSKAYPTQVTKCQAQTLLCQIDVRNCGLIPIFDTRVHFHWWSFMKNSPWLRLLGVYRSSVARVARVIKPQEALHSTSFIGSFIHYRLLLGLMMPRWTQHDTWQWFKDFGRSYQIFRLLFLNLLRV